MNYNKTITGGRLVRDPEFFVGQSGNRVGKFTVATSRKYKDNEEKAFIEVKVFGKQAEIIDDYFSKGDPILVEGRLVTEQWTDKQQNKKSRLIVYMESFSFVSGVEKKPIKKQEPQQTSVQPEYDDDVPF